MPLDMRQRKFGRETYPRGTAVSVENPLRLEVNMVENSHHEHGSGGGGGFGRFAFWGFILIAAYFLITEHRAHVVPYLPFLLLALCPLMHLFHGHGGHGGHEEHRDSANNPPERSNEKDSTHAQHGGH